MSKRILLIYPPSPVLNREDRCQQPTKELLVIPPLPPTDLMYLAAIAEQAGFEAKIKDYSLGGDFIQDVQDFAPDYILANVATPTFKSDMEALAKAKNVLPSAKIIVKGATFLTYNINVIYENPFIDYVIMGEPELTLKEILEGVPNKDILGICYSENNQGVKNELRPFNEDLDSLPFPARHLVDNSIYTRPDNGKVQGVIKVSRGCPYHCFFCLATPVSGAKVRMRSAENIIAEIKECVEKYNIKNFVFWSDIFNINRDWTIDLCKKIIASGLKITWSANTRANTMDDEMASYMYKAGCRLASIGVESGSQEVLDNIGKKITLDDIRNTVKILKKNKIKIYNYFVIGLPWETEKTVEETIKFAIELDSNFISFYTAAPLPGTRFFAYAMMNKLVDSNLDFDSAYYVPTVRSHELSKERIFELHKQAVRRFYLRPKFILKTLLGLRSFVEFKNYFKAGISLLMKK
ncbi:MAG: B12-binding domain-containing radical SAM protein [Candidatus Gastranaerophilales bacterium]|nr:B12-binding domain-containing radical SAM protein [Candidatus Gastranaerophilales bacterium]MCM1072726.1 B12-binding domain-containing radical SAM protein [Bacteroides sp.]